MIAQTRLRALAARPLAGGGFAGCSWVLQRVWAYAGANSRLSLYTREELALEVQVRDSDSIQSLGRSSDSGQKDAITLQGRRGTTSFTAGRANHKQQLFFTKSKTMISSRALQYWFLR